MQGICYIFGAGEVTLKQFAPKADDYVIAADGGFDHLKKLGVHPDMLLGDFDSLEAVPEHENIVRHPVEKDDTDTMLAAKTALQMGYRVFVVYGGTGGRLDHTLANIQLLSFLAACGAQGYLTDGDQVITVLQNKTVLFDAHSKGILSVFAHGGDACGVTETGLKYPLSGAVLRCDDPLGVSNAFLGVESSVGVAQGQIVVLWHEKNFHAEKMKFL